jgi:hypothetical protein
VMFPSAHRRSRVDGLRCRITSDATVAAKTSLTWPIGGGVSDFGSSK